MPTTADETNLLSSIQSWLGRVCQYLIVDRRTGRLSGWRLDGDKPIDGRAFAAALEWAEPYEGNIRSSRAVWTQWAEEVLGVAGLPAPEDCGERVRIIDEPGFKSRTVIPDSPVIRLDRVIARVQPGSAEQYAARIRSHAILKDWAEAKGDSKGLVVAASGLARVIAEMLGRADVLALLPDARRGTAVREGGKKGADRARGQGRPRAADEHRRWLRIAEGLQVALKRRMTAHQEAEKVARTVGAKPETVRKALRNLRRTRPGQL
jgi:hypothetical protein